MMFTESQIAQVLDRAEAVADKIGDTHKSFRHIWSGSIVRVTVDGVLYERKNYRESVADCCVSESYVDAETRLEVEVEAYGGS